MSLVKPAGAEGDVTLGAPGAVYNTYQSTFVPVNSGLTLQHINTRIKASSLRREPSTKTGRNLQFARSRALSRTQFYKLSFLTPPCKRQGRPRREWKVPAQGCSTSSPRLAPGRRPGPRVGGGGGLAALSARPRPQGRGASDPGPGITSMLQARKRRLREHPTCSDPQAATHAFNAGES